MNQAAAMTGCLARTSRLTAGGIPFEVCVADLDQQDVAFAASMLSDEERNPANRFVSPRDTSRYIAGRGLLRYLLAERLSMPAVLIELATSPYGKPVAAAAEASSLRLNVAD